MDFIINIDKQLFYFFNVTLANPVFDYLMPILTNQRNWFPIYLALFLFIIIKYRKNGLYILFAIFLAASLGDYINSSIIKNIVGRLRPCATLSDIHLLVSCGPGKSFMSSHAVNNFSLAYVLSFYFKENKWIFYTLASMVAYSRVAVGVHYPLDIIGGAVLGLGFGYIAIKITIWTGNYFAERKRKAKKF